MTTETTSLDTTVLTVGVLPGVTDVDLNDAALLGLARQKLSSMRLDLGSWRAVAEALSELHPASPAMWWKIENGQSHSTSLANVVLKYHGLLQIPVPVLVFPCPDCGEVHTGRCYGKPVADVAVLTPGEIVVSPQGAFRSKRPRQKPPAWVSEATAFLREHRMQEPPWPGSRAWWRAQRSKLSADDS